MERAERVILTNLCMIQDGTKVLVQEKVGKDAGGIIFPGGHVEKYESLYDSVIREMKEETGLTIESPVPCGFKDWINEDGSRYLVLLYKTNKFSGELRPSEEGRVFWTTREEFKRLPVMWNMREALEILDSDQYSECFWPFGTHESTLLG